MKPEPLKPNTKIAEWNAQLAHRLRVANEHNDRLKVRVVEMTVIAFAVGFFVGVII